MIRRDFLKIGFVSSFFGLPVTKTKIQPYLSLDPAVDYENFQPLIFVRDILKVNLTDWQKVQFERMWRNKNYTIPNNHDRCIGRSYLLAVYAITKSFYGEKVIIVASSLRQTKLIHTYISSILVKVISSMLNGFINYDTPSGIISLKWDKIKNDKILKTNSIYFSTVTNYGFIRGIRADVVLVDNFNSINKELFVKCLINPKQLIMVES